MSRKRKKKENKELVYVGLPTERTLMPDFVNSRDRVIEYLKGIGCYGGVIKEPGCRIDKNRNLIGRRFLRNHPDGTLLLMLDNDMEHPFSIGERLMRFNLPLVSGLYFEGTQYRDPVAYAYGRDGVGWDGVPGRMMDPLREPVYDFLMQNNWREIPGEENPAVSWIVENPKTDPLLKCDNFGAGCLMIRRDVLEKVSQPWFLFGSNHGEDIYFCDKVRKELDIPIYVDMSTISGHYRQISHGPGHFLGVYHQRGTLWGFVGFERPQEWLMDFFKWDEEKATNMLINYHPHKMAELWEQAKPTTFKEVDDFYRQEIVGVLYVLELIKFHKTPMYKLLSKELQPYRSGRVLDIGGGIGTLTIQMLLQRNDVVMVEPNEILRNFTQYRWDWLKSGLAEHNVYGNLEITDRLPLDRDFNMALAVDVFEHIHPDELPGMLFKLGLMIPERGWLLHHNNWKQQDLFPCHYDHEAQWDGWLRDAGFYPFNPPLWSFKVKP